MEKPFDVFYSSAAMSAKEPQTRSALTREAKSSGDVLELVAQYYPPNQTPVKTQYLIEGLFEEGRI